MVSALKVTLRPPEEGEGCSEACSCAVLTSLGRCALGLGASAAQGAAPLADWRCSSSCMAVHGRLSLMLLVKASGGSSLLLVCT